MTLPNADDELRVIITKMADWQGYYDEAKAALPEDVREFVDTTSWAGELHKDKRIELALKDVAALLHKSNLQRAIDELNKLHRYDGKDYDTELDEIIDNRVEELQAELQQAEKGEA